MLASLPFVLYHFRYGRLKRFLSDRLKLNTQTCPQPRHLIGVQKLISNEGHYQHGHSVLQSFHRRLQTALADEEPYFWMAQEVLLRKPLAYQHVRRLVL